MNTYFGKRTTNYKEFVEYFNKKTKMKLDNLFSAYLQTSEIPIVTSSESISGNTKNIALKLDHAINITMRIFYSVNGKEQNTFINSSKSQELKLPKDAKFELRTEKGYYGVR